MAGDERVDGAQVAALILSRMAGGRKERIAKAIKVRDPALYAKIEGRMYNFDDLLDLTGPSMQALLKVVEHDTLVVALKSTTDDIRTHVYRNLSERRRALVEDDLLERAPTRLSDVRGAQREILETVEELRRQGVIRTEDPNDLWV